MNGSTTFLITSLLLFAGGGGTGWVLARWECRRLAAHPPEVYLKRDQPLIPRGGPTRGAVALILVVAAVLLVAIGLQQAAFQRSQDRELEEQKARTACTQRWGQQVIDALDTRTRANVDVTAADKAVTAASARRDEAIDEIIGSVIALRAVPPTATTRDLDVALGHFASARVDLLTARSKAAAAQDGADRTRQQNPYPRLDCK